MFYDEIEQTLRELALGPEDEPREDEWEDDGRENEFEKELAWEEGDLKEEELDDDE